MSIALKFLEAEGVHLVNIDSTGNTVFFLSQKYCSFDQLKTILQRPKITQNLCWLYHFIYHLCQNMFFFLILRDIFSFFQERCPDVVNYYYLYIRFLHNLILFCFKLELKNGYYINVKQYTFEIKLKIV